MTTGWSLFVIILTIANILACFWLLRWTSTRPCWRGSRSCTTASGSTTVAIPGTGAGRLTSQ